MKIELKKSCGKPLYLQLYEAIVSEIHLNNLQANDTLPSRRVLAKQLNIAQTTVDNAYKMLQDTGYVISIPRHGYMVSFKTSEYISDIPWEKKPSEEYVLSPNGIDFDHFDRSQYAKISKEVLYNEGIDIFSYVEKSGEFELRNAISKYLYSFRDIKCSPWQIILGAGTEYLLTAISVLFDKNTKYIFEAPGEPHYYQALKTYNENTFILPPNIGDFDVDALYKSGGDILIIDSSGRFPRATGLTDNEMEKILKWANSSPKHYIIENGCETELNSVKKTLFDKDIHNKVIYLGSFSRIISPAVKCSYVVLPDKLLSAWKEKHIYYYSLISKQEQYTLAEFINKGYYVKHYKQVRKLYKEKKDYLCDCLINELGNNIEISKNYGSTYILARPALENLDDFIAVARNHGVKLFSFNSYNYGFDVKFGADNKLVLGVGDLSRTEILKSVKKIKEAFEKSD